MQTRSFGMLVSIALCVAAGICTVSQAQSPPLCNVGQSRAYTVSSTENATGVGVETGSAVKPSATIIITPADRCAARIAHYDPIENYLWLTSGEKIELGSVGARAMTIRSTPEAAFNSPLKAQTIQAFSTHGFILRDSIAVPGRSDLLVELWKGTESKAEYVVTTVKEREKAHRFLLNSNVPVTRLFVGPSIHGNLRWLFTANDVNPSGQLTIMLYNWFSDRIGDVWPPVNIRTRTRK